MKLSILIPSIPSRFDKGVRSYANILALCQGKEDIEVLMLTDNKKRTIGEKREALKNLSQGKYFMFVDDDDTLLSVQEIYKATEKDVDVITFKQRAFNNDGSEFIVTFGLGNEIEHNTENGNYLDCKRPPFPCCAWNKLYKRFKFPNINYGEDGVWVEDALGFAKSEYHIDKVLHSYNFNPNVTEASTENNEYWKNPNIKRCIVNFSTEQFIDGVERLCDSLGNETDNEGETILLYSKYEYLQAPSHSDNPYAFKIYAIEHARDAYNQILWLDASVYAVKDISPVWDWLTNKGIFLEEAGHMVGNWCNDYTLNYFGITRKQAMQMPMFAAGYVGFDFTNPISIEFFARWKESMLNGCFKGSWKDHRHDMTAGSIIANQMNLVNLYSPGGQFFSYIGEGFEKPKPTAVFHLQGI